LLLLLTAAANDSSAPRYTADGALMVPADYRDWVFLSSGLDMSYTEGMSMPHHMFDNVFVDPNSWAAFKKTGAARALRDRSTSKDISRPRT
jgi:hypothetical protein